ncbi:MAG TPA: hypothetical protein VGC56_13105 [Allosphingosinicella sp.]|jgi:hypothetical protein
MTVQLRGIGDVVAAEDLVSGQFYHMRHHDAKTTLLQVIEEEQPEGIVKWALEFREHSDGGARLDEIYDGMMYVEVPNVHIRIEPTSFAGDSYSTSSHAGMLLVGGGAVILLATPPRNYGWISVDLMTGKIVRKQPTEWAWFSRWSLVTDDADEEKELFGYDLPRR